MYKKRNPCGVFPCEDAEKDSLGADPYGPTIILLEGCSNQALCTPWMIAPDLTTLSHIEGIRLRVFRLYTLGNPNISE